MLKQERKKILSALIIPMIFVALLWLIKATEELLQVSFHTWGVFPLSVQGLKGIIFSPLIHGSFQHLISNTFPLLVLGWALFYFYGKLALRITLFAWVISGLWVWVFARESWHIGASGIIYSWAAFLFVSGVIRHHPRLMALSLLVAFLYGSMVWGIFPLRERISWEGHLMGLVAGLVLALFFREEGPQRKKYSWELEEEDEEDQDPDHPPYWMHTHITENTTRQEEVRNAEGDKGKRQKTDATPTGHSSMRVKYHFVPRQKTDEGTDNTKRSG
ncbi:MAG: rhomboid family intramembrane serine protease [Bacteroidota bacterium]